jgi:pyruvate kinase
MRFTKIVATIGPATSDPSKIATLIESGMNVARLNFAHGSHESHNRVIDAVHAYNKKHGTAVAVMLDTKGPEIRTGDVHDPINIKRGDEVLFTSQHPANEKRTIVEVNYDEFPKDAKSASTILIDNGVLEFDIIDVSPRGVVAKAKESGAIGTRRHINLPGATITMSLPASMARTTRSSMEPAALAPDISTSSVIMSPSKRYFCRRISSVKTCEKAAGVPDGSI